MPIISLTPFYQNIPQVTYYEYTTSLSPEVYWRLGDIPPISIDDEFVGIDGNLPNQTLWNTPIYDPNIDSGTSPGTTIIQNNQLNMNVTNDIANTILTSKFYLTGDFDIQIDYSLTAIPADSFSFGLMVSDSLTIDLFGSNSAYIGRYKSVSGPYRANVTDGTAVTGGTNDTVGKFRIVRIDSLFTFYYWDNISNWILLTSKTSVTSDLYIKLFARTWNTNQTLDVNFDNLKINYGTIVNSTVADDNDLYNGTYINNVSQNLTSLLQNEQDNSTIEFNGIDQYADVTSFLPFIETEISGMFCFLAQLNNPGDACIIFSTSDSTITSPYVQFLLTESLFRITFNITNNAFNTDVVKTFALGVPYHICVAPDPIDSYHVFINGVQYIPTPISGTDGDWWFNNIQNQQDNAAIGALLDSTPVFQEGSVDELCYFTNILNSQQVSTMFDLTGIGTYFPYVMELGPISYWRLNDINSPNNINDAFFGNNGRPPNKNLWIPANTHNIQNNSLTVNIKNNIINEATFSLYALTGDFDIQIDYNIIKYSEIVAWRDKLRIRNIDTDDFVEIERNYDSNVEALGGHELGFNRFMNGITTTDYSATTGNLSSKFRLTRVGSTVQGYIWNSTSWTLINTYSWNANDIKIELRVTTLTNNQDHIMSYDNFIVNSGTIINPYAIDQTISNATGIHINQPTLETTSLLQDGSADASISYNGIDQYTSLDTILSTLQTLNTGSVSFLANFPINGNCGLFMGNSNSDNNYIIFQINETGATYNYLEDNATVGVNNFTVSTSNTFAANTNYHVVMVHDATNGILIYINGTLQNTTIVGTPGDKWWNDNLTINNISINGLRRPSATYYKGTVDEVIIYDKILLPSEINTMYQKSIGN